VWGGGAKRLRVYEAGSEVAASASAWSVSLHPVLSLRMKNSGRVGAGVSIALLQPWRLGRRPDQPIVGYPHKRPYSC